MQLDRALVMFSVCLTMKGGPVRFRVVHISPPDPRLYFITHFALNNEMTGLRILETVARRSEPGYLWFWLVTATKYLHDR